MATDFDFCFESAFCQDAKGRSLQMIIVHKYHLGGNVWHVFTVDSNNYYHSGYYKLNREEWTFKRVTEQVAEDEQLVPV